MVAQIASTCLFFCNSLEWVKCQNQRWSWNSSSSSPDLTSHPFQPRHIITGAWINKTFFLDYVWGRCFLLILLNMQILTGLTTSPNKSGRVMVIRWFWVSLIIRQLGSLWFAESFKWTNWIHLLFQHSLIGTENEQLMYNKLWAVVGYDKYTSLAGGGGHGTLSIM